MANQRAAKPLASKAVFVNCPFDEEFKPIFRAMIFAVISSGYNPRRTLDSTDGAEIRVSKIATMIGECDYGIHDLSRVEMRAAYRDSTCRWNWDCTSEHALFGSCRHKRKRALILA